MNILDRIGPYSAYLHGVESMYIVSNGKVDKPVVKLMDLDSPLEICNFIDDNVNSINAIYADAKVKSTLIKYKILKNVNFEKHEKYYKVLW